MAKRKRYGSFTWTDPKTGYLYSRVRVSQPDGNKKTVYRRAQNLTHAKQLADEIRAEHENRGQAYLDGEKMTVADLAEWYKETYVIAPIYNDGAKVAGMRTWEGERKKIDRIVDVLGKIPIADLDEEAINRYRMKRMKSVKIATVNRDMETIRRMLRKAKVKKWIKTVPDFSELHHKALEKRRTVTVTDEQIETIIEAARTFTNSPRLYALILTLYDSGARPHEIYPVGDYGKDYSTDEGTKYFPLRWRDLFDEDGEIVPVSIVTSTKGQQIEKRLLVVTNRMAQAYRELWSYLQNSKNVLPENGADLDNLVFPKKSFQSAWEKVRLVAGMKDLRLRDLRRDWVSRLARKGFSDRLAQRGAGHKRMQQTFEYTEFDLQAAMQAKELLDEVIESDSTQ